MTNKHTPRPWRLTDDPVRRVIVSGSGIKARTICIIEDWTTEPDAQLLAAAADYYDAADALLRAWDSYGAKECGEAIDKLRAAHARAAGRLP